jgi:hypothetical protein
MKCVMANAEFGMTIRSASARTKASASARTKAKAKARTKANAGVLGFAQNDKD